MLATFGNSFFNIIDTIIFLCLTILIVLVIRAFFTSKGNAIKQLVVDGFVASIVASVLTHFILIFLEDYKIKNHISDGEYVVCLKDESGHFQIFGSSSIHYSFFTRDLKIIGYDLNKNEILEARGDLVSNRYLVATYASRRGSFDRRIGTIAYEMGPEGESFSGMFSYIDYTTNSFKHGEAKWIKKKFSGSNSCEISQAI